MNLGVEWIPVIESMEVSKIGQFWRTALEAARLWAAAWVGLAFWRRLGYGADAAVVTHLDFHYK